MKIKTPGKLTITNRYSHWYLHVHYYVVIVAYPNHIVKPFLSRIHILSFRKGLFCKGFMGFSWPSRHLFSNLFLWKRWQNQQKSRNVVCCGDPHPTQTSRLAHRFDDELRLRLSVRLLLLARPELLLAGDRMEQPVGDLVTPQVEVRKPDH